MPSVDGLISGLDTTSIIQQLLEFSSRPIERLTTRIDERQTQKDAISSLTTKLLDLKLTSFDLTKASTYRATDVNSTNDNILAASGTTIGTTGSFDFRVAQLARSSQLVSDGMPDADSSTVGAGSFTIEMGDGFIDHETRLESINGGEGFARGSLRVTDGAGTTEVIDLGLAVTVQDVVDTFNGANSVQISAEVLGDGLILRDQSGGGSLTIAEIGDGTTADSLGLLKSDVAGVVTGNDINTIKSTTRLAQLNDGNGVRTISGDDFRVSLNDTSSFDVDISSAETLQDVVSAINNDPLNGGKATASLDEAGKALRVIDNTVGAGIFSIDALTGAFGKSGSVVDLGLEDITPENATGATDAANGTSITGKRLIGTLNSLLTRTLNGGRQADGSGGGVSDGSITVTDRQGNTDTINLASRVETTTTADPALGTTSIFVASTSGLAVGNTIRLNDGTNTEYRVLTGVNTGTGELTFTEGLSFDFAASTAVYGSNENVSDVINAISNNATVNLTARFNRELNGLKIVDDNTGTATSDLSIVESGGTVAAELGIKTGVDGAQTVSVGGSTTQLTSATLAGLNLQDDQLNGLELLFTSGANTGLKRTILDYDHSTGTVTFDSAFPASISAAENFTITGTDNDDFNGFDLNKKYISENTSLEELNNGDGVFQGKFQVTDRNNKIFQVDLSSDETVDDAILSFNAAAAAVGSDATLTVNVNGNGLVINSPTGTGQITVQDLNGGTTAQDLNLDGSSATGTLDGSYEYTITLDGTETLGDVRDEIASLGLDVSATIINDGSSLTPYRLNLVSNVSGRPGRLLLDDFDNSFNFSTTTKAEDAALIFGGSGGGSTPVLVSSTNNTISNLIPGLTLDLKKISSETVTVTIERNTDSMVESVSSFVEGFNETLDDIRELIAYDSENEEPGLLQGNATLRNIEQQMFRSLTASLEGVPGPYNRASQLGLTVKGDGTGMEFDEAVFRSAIEDDFEAVKRALDLGASIQLATELASLKGGQGVRDVSGSNDFAVTLSDGTRLEINLDGLDTIAEVINALNFHPDNTGDLVAELRSDGEGIKLTDSSAGGGNFTVTAMSNSSAALDLGIQQQGVSVGSDFVIKGFSLRDQGIFGRMNGRLGNIVDSGGSLANQSDAFDDMIEDLQSQVERIEQRVLSEQERLFRQFSELERTLGELQSQSSFIAGQLGR